MVLHTRKLLLSFLLWQKLHDQTTVRFALTCYIVIASILFYEFSKHLKFVSYHNTATSDMN